MGDLFTQINSASAASSSAAAASSAAKALKEATAAKNASEERLEATGKNSFIVFECLEYDYEKQPGFFSSDKKRLQKTGIKRSIKKTDIAGLSEGQDSFGTVFTYVNLESRCDLFQEEDISQLRVAGSIEEVTNYINSF